MEISLAKYRPPVAPVDSDLAHAAKVIAAGGVVAYPTESCFGLGCDPHDTAAVRRIMRMKRRAAGKGFILIADSPRRLLPFLAAGGGFSAQILASWPGPNTWLLPAGRRAGRHLCGGQGSLAVRVSAHRTAARLCRLARSALVSTSANRSGRRMLRSAAAVQREFGGEVDFIVDARIGGAHAPSVIRDGASGRVVRG